MKQRRIFSIALSLMVFAAAGCSKAKEEVVPDQQAAEPEVQKAKIGDMVLIPAGEFTMGSNKGDKKTNYAAPEHKVNLPAYYIDAYEVTFGQFIEFTTKGDYEPESNWRTFYTVGKEDYPVPNITLDDAKAYAKWAGKRIPTEAEWEKAARGPEAFAYPWGNNWDWAKTNTGESGMRGAMKAGEMSADKSPYGVYDMMGNLMEWTSDEFKAYKGSPVAGDINFTRGYYTVRGASYLMYPSKGNGMYLWTRQAYFPKSQYGIGFRCAKDGEPQKQVLNLDSRVLALLLPNVKQLSLR